MDLLGGSKVTGAWLHLTHSTLWFDTGSLPEPRAHPLARLAGWLGNPGEPTLSVFRHWDYRCTPLQLAFHIHSGWECRSSHFVYSAEPSVNAYASQPICTDSTLTAGSCSCRVTQCAIGCQASLYRIGPCMIETTVLQECHWCCGPLNYQVPLIYLLTVLSGHSKLGAMVSVLYPNRKTSVNIVDY